MADHHAAEALLMAEIGADAMQELKPYYSALVGVADLALSTGGPHFRSLLRHVGVLASKVAALEGGVTQWRAVSQDGQLQLAKASAQLAAARQSAESERTRAEVLQSQLVAVMRDREANKVVAQTNAQWLQVEAQKANLELKRSHSEVLALQEEVRRLRIELEVTSSKQRQQEAHLEAERLRAAGADLSAEHAEKGKARLEAALKRADEEQRENVETLTAQVQQQKQRLERRLEAERNEAIQNRQVMSNLESTVAEIRSVMPSLLEAADFLRDPHSPALKMARGPVLLSVNSSVRIPVLALRWAPKLGLNSTPGWAALREGLFALFHQLQTGAMVPEQVELRVCEAGGRWFCCEEQDTGPFAALLMFQALHRDAPISATCRMSTKVMLPAEELEKHSGLSVLSTAAMWRTPPQHEEDFLRALLVGSSLEEVFRDFLYHQRRGRVEDAFEEELKRDGVMGRRRGELLGREASMVETPLQQAPVASATPVAPSFSSAPPARGVFATTAQAAAAAAAQAAQSAASRGRSGVKPTPI
ncbi:Curved DNA-binding protein [Durusdinium trenchii]|uniref:Curved DNA-binding protein n=1 Tax=Durusdinium trenchii TaxID=1381693 RepID=A0ABP0R7Z8_9DINO